MLRALLIAAIPAAAIAVPAWASDFVTGPQLTQACAGKTPLDAARCDGYIAGALDMVVDTPELRSRVCPPPNTKLSALREALGRYGKDHASDAKGSAIALLTSMIKTNYPCPAAK